jgi:hypothetical protein
MYRCILIAIAKRRLAHRPSVTWSPFGCRSSPVPDADDAAFIPLPDEPSLSVTTTS